MTNLLKAFCFVFLLICFLPAKAQNQFAELGLVATNPIERHLWLKWVNEVRSKGCHCGDKYMPPAPPLLYNAALERAAYKHSMDMMHQNYFSHKSKNGNTLRDRADAEGGGGGFLGENIAWGTSLSELDAFENWMNSPGHCENIMNKRFGVLAVGKSHPSDYYTMMLANRGQPISSQVLKSLEPYKADDNPEVLVSGDVAVFANSNSNKFFEQTPTEAQPKPVAKPTDDAYKSNQEKNFSNRDRETQRISAMSIKKQIADGAKDIGSELSDVASDLGKTRQTVGKKLNRSWRKTSRKVSYRWRKTKRKLHRWFR